MLNRVHGQYRASTGPVQGQESYFRAKKATSGPRKLLLGQGVRSSGPRSQIFRAQNCQIQGPELSDYGQNCQESGPNCLKNALLLLNYWSQIALLARAPFQKGTLHHWHRAHVMLEGTHDHLALVHTANSTVLARFAAGTGPNVHGRVCFTRKQLIYISSRQKTVELGP